MGFHVIDKQYGNEVMLLPDTYGIHWLVQPAAYFLVSNISWWHCKDKGDEECFQAYKISYMNCWVIYLCWYVLVEDAQLTPLLRLGAGACAGIIAMSATYPMDMVRGRLTVQVLWAILKMSIMEEFRCFLMYFLSIITVYPFICRQRALHISIGE